MVQKQAIRKVVEENGELETLDLDNTTEFSGFLQRHMDQACEAILHTHKMLSDFWLGSYKYQCNCALESMNALRESLAGESLCDREKNL